MLGLTACAGLGARPEPAGEPELSAAENTAYETSEKTIPEQEPVISADSQKEPDPPIGGDSQPKPDKDTPFTGGGDSKKPTAQTEPPKQANKAPLLAGCWETTDRGDAEDGITRRDIILDEETYSVRTDWMALEFDPISGTFSWWERDWEKGMWKVRCYKGSATYDGEYLHLSASVEILYENTEFEELTAPVATGAVPDGDLTVLKVIEWDEDCLLIDGWESFYNFAGKDDKPPRVW